MDSLGVFTGGSTVRIFVGVFRPSGQGRVLSYSLQEKSKCPKTVPKYPKTLPKQVVGLFSPKNSYPVLKLWGRNKRYPFQLCTNYGDEIRSLWLSGEQIVDLQPFLGPISAKNSEIAQIVQFLEGKCGSISEQNVNPRSSQDSTNLGLSSKPHITDYVGVDHKM